MKLILQGALISCLLHILYFVGNILIGFWKTSTFEPEIINSFENVTMLQNEVVIGTVREGFPYMYIFTFIGATIVCSILLYVLKKRRSIY